MQFIRSVKDGGHYDLIVCGAGPRYGCGYCAAQEGRRVLLMDAAGCLGGYWTSGLMSVPKDMQAAYLENAMNCLLRIALNGQIGKLCL